MRAPVLLCVSAIAAAGLSPSLDAAGAGNEAPWSSSPPVVTGEAVQGGTLTVTSGTWHGEHIVFTYEWDRCSARADVCAPILGATSEAGVPFDMLVPTQADVGSRLRVVVTAANAAGTAQAISNETSPVVARGPRVRSGRLERFMLFSPAVGRAQPVYVYLPPGYDPRARRGYPVLYLLHGYPGGPGSFVGGVPAGPTEDQLVARGLMQPTILVMPLGAPDVITETSWANGVGPDSAWETFLARDVVDWVDLKFDTIRKASGRGIAGLSDGGFGALDIALHHPSEFGLVESWSGYEHADPTETAVFGTDPNRLAFDSPADVLPRVARTLRVGGFYVWLTVGWQDGERFENAQFASELAVARVSHAFVLVPGSHLPSVYRAELPAALVVASRHLGPRAAPPGRAELSARTPPGPRLGFAFEQRGSDLETSGHGVITLRSGSNPESSAEQDAVAATGIVQVAAEGRLQLALAPGAVVAHERGAEDAVLLSLPVVVRGSSGSSCPVGAHGYVDLERASAPTGTTDTLVVDLRPACGQVLSFDDAPWRRLPPSAFTLRIGQR